MQRHNLAKGLLWFGLSAITLTGFSGCGENLSSGPVAIRGSGETFELALCRQSTVVTGVLLHTSPGGRGDWTKQWDVSDGNVVLTSGEALQQKDVVSDFGVITSADPPRITSGTDVDVLIFTDNDDYVIAATFALADAYGGSKWAHPDGSSSDHPCRADKPAT